MASMACHVEAMLALRARGAVTFDYGNNIRAQAKRAGVENAFDIPGFVPEYVRPLFCEGKGPFRWVALSGDPDDILATDQAALDMFSDDEALCRWIRMARERVKFQGLPARICWLGYGDRARFGHRINELVRTGAIKAPIVIGRDHLDSRLGGVAVSRNGGHARRQRRDCRLAGAERAAERVGRRDMGVGASRRRSRDRLFAACGHGGRRRRDAGGRREDRARADVRSRHRRGATCRRGISRGARDGEVARHQTSDARPFDRAAGSGPSRGAEGRKFRAPRLGAGRQTTIVTGPGETGPGKRGTRNDGSVYRIRPARHGRAGGVTITHSSHSGGMRNRPHIAAAAVARPRRPRRGAVHRRGALRHHAGAVSPGGRLLVAVSMARDGSDAGQRARARSTRSCVSSTPPALRAARRARSCSTRCSSCARSKASPACGMCCAICSRRCRQAPIVSC